MARWYNDALLVVESNSWEGGSEGRGHYISTLADSYVNMYYRRSKGASTGRLPGFHTNVHTKASLIAHLIAMVRDGLYVERDPGACDELMQYESLSDGSYAARRGCHDDILHVEGHSPVGACRGASSSLPALALADCAALFAQ